MSKITEKVAEVVKPIVEGLGIELVEVKFDHTKAGDALTLFIDKEGGVTLDDCEAVHNAVDLPLDELDPTDGESYTLNVSSLGLDRPFKTDRDYDKHIGVKVEVGLFAPLAGVGKKFTATLTAHDSAAGTVTLDTDGGTITLAKQNIAIIREHIEF